MYDEYEPDYACDAGAVRSVSRGIIVGVLIGNTCKAPTKKMEISAILFLHLSVRLLKTKTGMRRTAKSPTELRALVAMGGAL